MKEGKLHYLEYLSLSPTKANDQHDKAQHILDEYDFIAITERMDESIVALMMLLGRSINDVIGLTVKTKGGWDDGSFQDTCFYIVPSFVSSSMKAYFQSQEWKEYIQYEEALYAAANRALDMTIERLDPELFEQNLKRYREVQQVAYDRCIDRTVFPCSDGGVRNRENDCVIHDYGCGQECLDEVADELGLSKSMVLDMSIADER
jgi:hypothetical protein